MATILSEVSSSLAVDQWQLDRIVDLFKKGVSGDDIADKLNLNPVLVHEVIEIRYFNK
jgi:hypothetical protein